MPSYPRQKQYSKFLSREKIPLACSYCNQSMLSKVYEKHCTEQHGLDAKLCCVWCDGTVKWKRGQKEQNADHLIECWRQIKARQSPPAPPPPPELEPCLPARIRPFNFTPLCPAGDWFGHKPAPGVNLAYYTDPVAVASLPPSTIPFRDDSLNLAASAIQHYVAHHETMDWLHLMVHVAALPRLFRALKQHAPYLGTLPFFCMCDGGCEADPLFRQHRHLILFSSEKGYLRCYVLPEISLDADERPGANYKSYWPVKIEETLHLLHTIGYVSKRESRCQFSNQHDQTVLKILNHFLIQQTLATDYRWALGCLWEGGMMKVVDQHYRKLPHKQLLPLPFVIKDGHYEIQVKYLPDPPHVELTLANGYRVTETPTPRVLYLGKDQRRYVERGESAEPFDVMHALRHEWWTPSPKQQKYLVDNKARYDFDLELKKENARLLQELATVFWWKQKAAEAQEEMEQVKQRLVDMEKEQESLKQKLAEMERELSIVPQLKRKLADMEKEQAAVPLLKRKLTELMREKELSQRRSEAPTVHVNVSNTLNNAASSSEQ